MKAYDYEAVVYDGAVYCVGCLPDGVSASDSTWIVAIGDTPEVFPVFADSEWDTAPVCAHCAAVHDYVTVLRGES